MWYFVFVYCLFLSLSPPNNNWWQLTGENYNTISNEIPSKQYKNYVNYVTQLKILPEIKINYCAHIIRIETINNSTTETYVVFLYRVLFLENENVASLKNKKSFFFPYSLEKKQFQMSLPNVYAQQNSASKMTYIVSGGALNSTHSLYKLKLLITLK